MQKEKETRYRMKKSRVIMPQRKGEERIEDIWDEDRTKLTNKSKQAKK